MKRLTKQSTTIMLAVGLLAILAVVPARAQDSVTITLAAYTVPREAYAQIIPLFEADWLTQTGQTVNFEESYLGSGAQSRAVAGGFEADVVALSLEADVTRLVDAGLITHDWKDNRYGGNVSTSVAVLVVRPGNPLEIKDWADLAKPGVEVITPNAETSGGAQWNVLAAYGAAYRGQVTGYAAGDEGARQFLHDLFSNVSVMDASGRESFLTFERGIGDVAITYENEYYAGIAAGGDYEIVYPTSTVLIENPVALVDTYADQHGTREVTQAFIDFLYRPEIQAIFAQAGFRPPVDASADTASAEPDQPRAFWAAGSLDLDRFPLVPDLFTVADFGGWAEAGPHVFGEDGVYSQVIAEVQGG